jgi:hypothetical protein
VAGVVVALVLRARRPEVYAGLGHFSLTDPALDSPQPDDHQPDDHQPDDHEPDDHQPTTGTTEVPA